MHFRYFNQTKSIWLYSTCSSQFTFGQIPFEHRSQHSSHLKVCKLVFIYYANKRTQRHRKNDTNCLRKEVRFFWILPSNIYLCWGAKRIESSRMSCIDLGTWIWACWSPCGTLCRSGWWVSGKELSALCSFRSKDAVSFVQWCAPRAPRHREAAI